MKDYTEEQKAAIAACDATLQAAKLPTYSDLEDKLYQALAACSESIAMGKRLYQELTAKRQTSITRENFPAFKEAYDQAVNLNADQFTFEGAKVLTSYGKYVIEYLSRGDK